MIDEMETKNRRRMISDLDNVINAVENYENAFNVVIRVATC